MGKDPHVLECFASGCWILCSRQARASTSRACATGLQAPPNSATCCAHHRHCYQPGTAAPSHAIICGLNKTQQSINCTDCRHRRVLTHLGLAMVQHDDNLPPHGIICASSPRTCIQSRITIKALLMQTVHDYNQSFIHQQSGSSLHELGGTPTLAPAASLGSSEPA